MIKVTMNSWSVFTAMWKVYSTNVSSLSWLHPSLTGQMRIYSHNYVRWWLAETIQEDITIFFANRFLSLIPAISKRCHTLTMKCLKSFQGLSAKEEADQSTKHFANKFSTMIFPVCLKVLRISSLRLRTNTKMCCSVPKMRCTKLTTRLEISILLWRP
jgi:hypothetical protein